MCKEHFTKFEVCGCVRRAGIELCGREEECGDRGRERVVGKMLGDCWVCLEKGEKEEQGRGRARD
jgi:hypothetical protein